MASQQVVLAAVGGAAVGAAIALAVARALQPSQPVNDEDDGVILTVGDIEVAGNKKLPACVRMYFAYCAGDKITKAHIEASFVRILLRTRILRDVSSVDTRTTILGKEVSSPIMIAPTGFHGLAHVDGERATARAAAAKHVAYAYNYVFSNTAIEEVAKNNGSGVRLASVYILKDRAYVLHALRQIESLGFTGILVTCDHPHDRVKNNSVPHFDAATSRTELAAIQKAMVFPNAANYLRSTGVESDEPLSAAVNDASLTWADVEWLISNTTLPVICKGILYPEEARRAVQAGARGVIVSNHGARQMDSIPAAISLLSDVVRAVGKDIEVYIDSGFRTGTHVLKALALGARGVFVGRPVLWGLAYNGQAGVEKVLTIMHSELVYDMKSTGCSSIADITAEVLHSC